MRILSSAFDSIQKWLFPVLEEGIGELSKKQGEFVRVVELIDPEKFITANQLLKRPESWPTLKKSSFL